LILRPPVVALPLVQGCVNMASSFEKSVKGATKIKVNRGVERFLKPLSSCLTSVLTAFHRPLPRSPSTIACPFQHVSHDGLTVFSSRYIEHILIATHSGEAGVAEVFRALQNRLRDSTWTVVFKSLITVHLMIREGSPDVTLAYLSRHRNMLAISSFSDGRPSVTHRVKVFWDHSGRSLETN
jgi:hypothetical protein